MQVLIMYLYQHVAEEIYTPTWLGSEYTRVARVVMYYLYSSRYGGNIPDREYTDNKLQTMKSTY